MRKYKLQDTIKFIKLYKQERCLWCPDSEHYRNHNEREQALQRICEKLDDPWNKNITRTKNKIKRIRFYYGKELCRIRENYLAGVEYTPKMLWYNHMCFMPDYIKIEELPYCNAGELEKQLLSESKFSDGSVSDLTENKINSITINDVNSQSEEYSLQHHDDKDLEFLDIEIQSILIKGILKMEKKQKENIPTDNECKKENSDKNLNRKRSYNESMLRI